MKKIQQAFSEVYPYLKLEFLGLGDKKNSKSKNVEVSHTTLRPAEINISGERTIAELQADFRKLCNIPIQVLRKTGSVWIETTYTQDWTLDQQNKEGELLSKTS